MTQGISQSLNLALARVNYIEHSFSALENIAGTTSMPTNTIESDFKKILDKKLEETTTIEKIATPEEKPEISEEITSGMEIIAVSEMSEVLDYALERK